jgi:hypothetical protein
MFGDVLRISEDICEFELCFTLQCIVSLQGYFQSILQYCPSIQRDPQRRYLRTWIENHEEYQATKTATDSILISSRRSLDFQQNHAVNLLRL